MKKKYKNWPVKSKEEIQEMPLAQAEKYLEELESRPENNLSLLAHPSLLKDSDLYANEMLDVYARIERIRQLSALAAANAVRLAK